MQIGVDFKLINEEFFADRVSGPQLDVLLQDGWRHFGLHFFRYNLAVYEGEIRRVMPLRIRVADFILSKSQRRVIRRNDQLDVSVAPSIVDEEIHDLFDQHKGRFKTGVPDSIYNFISPEPGVPIEGWQLRVSRNGKLLAVSFFDMGATSLSSIYGIFALAESARSLGIFTMLKEIEFAVAAGKSFYYHGYAYEGNSYYDYKKRFSVLEVHNWDGGWSPLSPDVEMDNQLDCNPSYY